MRTDIGRCSLIPADVCARAWARSSPDEGISLSPLLKVRTARMPLTQFGTVGSHFCIWVIGHAFGRVRATVREILPDTRGHWLRLFALLLGLSAPPAPRSPLTV